MKLMSKIAIFCRRMTFKKPSTPIVILISTFSALILYILFFVFSTFIWSKNLKIDFATISPYARLWISAPGERDGIETYVLYFLVFACIGLTLFFVWMYSLLLRLKKNWLLVLVVLGLALVAGIYYLKIGFYPPMSYRVLGLTSLLLMVVVMLVTWLLIKIDFLIKSVASLMIIVLLLPICFVASSPISPSDYAFVFAPALRLLNNFAIKDIYFQYDLLLSLIAAVWLKFKINLNYFQILGQFSYYLLFLVLFFFSKRLFNRKALSYYFLVALVLVKIYGLMGYSALLFQVTPLRLDWWLLVLVLSYVNGIYGKQVGILLGLLIIFHRTFGIIYTIGYLEIIFVLFILNFFENKISTNCLITNLKKHIKLTWPNIFILLFSTMVSYILLNGVSLEAASNYQRIGIGFMPISEVSFYWYFPVLAGVTIVLLLLSRKRLSEKYFNSGLLLVALSIGNSIYFFGRSHENNIINISASLIFVIFLLFDLITFPLTIKGWRQSKLGKIVYVLIPSAFILIITFFYSAGILIRGQIQLTNLFKRRVIYPMSLAIDIKKVGELTKNSKKVYFTGSNDFYYYYYGGYVPVGHYFPFVSWLNKKDEISFMQNLLDRGYYVVSPRNGDVLDIKTDDEVLSELKYSKSVIQDGFKVVW